MKYIVAPVGALFVLFGIVTALSAQPLPGGVAKASIAKKEVQDAATYAVKAQAKAMQSKKDGQAAKLELVKILSAEEQVVSGMNYRLKLLVRVNGKDKRADAEVWWQSWRKPDPYQLTSWKWTSK
ncbi:MAG TPA: cystatin domain-containing protein [Terrimicrobiaceae bacterium]